MKPSECLYYQPIRDKVYVRCGFKGGTCFGDSCPMITLALRCQENWAYADTVMGMSTDARSEIAALTERVRQHYEQHDAEKALLWKEISALTEKVEEYARMVLNVSAKREVDQTEIERLEERVKELEEWKEWHDNSRKHM